MEADLTDSTTVFRLPRSHWHCHLSNFTWKDVRPTTLQDHLMQFLLQVAAGHSPHLLLTGRPGVGKTHLGVAAYRWMVPRTGTLLTTWLNVPHFCDQVKAAYSPSAYGHGGDPLLDYAEASRLVVLDDLFGRELTSHEAGQIIYRLLDTAYQNDAGILITMNQAHTELATRLPQHEISRLLAQSTIIPLQGKQDWRRRKVDV